MKDNLYNTLNNPGSFDPGITLERLTQPKNWDYDLFKRVLLFLRQTKSSYAIPAINRPDSIHLQGLGETISKLLRLTLESSSEHAQMLFIDHGHNSLVTGKITKGSATQVRLNTDKQPGRELFQTAIGSFHTHPTNGGGEQLAHGLSGQDYKTLLSDNKQQLMVIAFGANTRIMVLKTSVTPTDISSQSLSNRMCDCENDYLSAKDKNPMVAVVNFNKSVCTEFGLLMYVADQQSKDLFNRVAVTK